MGCGFVAADVSSAAFCMPIYGKCRGEAALLRPLCFISRKKVIKMSLLEVTNLSHAYGDKVLYEDASFALQLSLIHI